MTPLDWSGLSLSINVIPASHNVSPTGPVYNISFFANMVVLSSGQTVAIAAVNLIKKKKIKMKDF